MNARTIVITGVASGIGRALARRLSQRGERVIGIDLRDAEIIADISAEQQRAAVLSRLEASCTHIDAVVSCAGIAAPADGASIVSVNYFGTVRLVESLLPLLSRGTEPRAVLIASIATLLPANEQLVQLCLSGRETEARDIAQQDSAIAYASSKRALARWIRRCAPQPQWAGRGVLLNGISPGTIKTAMANPILASAEGRAMLAQAVPIAVGDYAEPEDIAPLLAFLASAENRFMVGQIPFVDGGSDTLIRGEVVL